ncbi:MAG: YggS family pyridoxal phosphate-dependent enzyme [Alcaligenaceae bacterium]|nr:YggS family pyridoxal phosphate-dependent enzyme [Alcaligenaceae bacterium]
MTTPTQENRYPTALTVDDFKHNLAVVRQKIATACQRSGRDAHTVRLLPVSKTVDKARIQLAYEAGCHFLGENKVQEAFDKWQSLSALNDLQWSIIGHLQTNKAKFVAKFAAEFQALDSIRLAEALERKLQEEGRSIDVFIQVNTSGETSKYGLHPEETAAFIKSLASFDCLKVKGFMTLACLSDNEQRVRSCFRLLRNLRDQRQQDAPANMQLHELSMGMSGDYEMAVEEGATVVRVGQAIFGARALPDSYYWPTHG